MGSSRYFQQQELDVVSGGLPEVTDTLMADPAARRRVAEETLRFAESLRA